ncbi:hypothetical protein L4D08_26325, partial [Photobacterium chitinilyticum]|uniref:hypothetical protein n=1 Tax=Photobacterium chitinilyticum TaxID=2485123 RepID=UPI003D107C4A
SIVSNIYLDKLIYTILNKGHIPSITLVSDEVTDSELGYFKVLDGLQRTNRIKIIYATLAFFHQNRSEIVSESSEFVLRRKYRKELNDIGSNGVILSAIRSYYNKHGAAELDDCFDSNVQWFEIWEGLSPQEQINKMLTLNAGHKSVNIKHQLELMFQNLNTLLDKVDNGNVSFVREKDISSTKYSRERNVGLYYFPHVISSLVSYIEKEPVVTNNSFVEKIQNNEEELQRFTQNISFDFIDGFVNSLYKLDVAFTSKYEKLGNQWFSREVSLSSMFAAIGKHSSETSDMISIVDMIIEHVSEVNLEQFNKTRKNIDLSKVNIGNINRKQIFQAFDMLIENKFSSEVDWEVFFTRGEK